jgi:hypothetical protein
MARELYEQCYNANYECQVWLHPDKLSSCLVCSAEGFDLVVHIVRNEISCKATSEPTNSIGRPKNEWHYTKITPQAP